MTKIEIKFQSEKSLKGFSYTNQSVNVVFTVDRKLPITDGYNLKIYNDQLMLISKGDTLTTTRKKSGRYSYGLSMKPIKVWMPGHYFLLVSHTCDFLQRFEIDIDEHLGITISEGRNCPKFSFEHILCECFHHGLWGLLSTIPGTRDILRWVHTHVGESLVCKETDKGDKLAVSKNVVFTFCNEDHSSLIANYIARYLSLNSSLINTNCGKTFSYKNTNRKEDIDYLFVKPKRNFSSILNDEKEENVYIYENIGILSSEEGADVTKEMAKAISEDSAVIFVGSKTEIENFANRNPSIIKWVPECNYLKESPLTREDVISYFLKTIGQQKMQLSPECLDRLCKTLTESYSRGIVSNWSISDMRLFVCNDLKQRYLKRILYDLGTGKPTRSGCPVEAEDINEEKLLSGSHSLDKAMAEINSMIGLGDIKQSIRTLVNRTLFFARRKSLGLKVSDQAVFHAVFSGNPGTGKTTVAKLLGKVYHSLGILSKGNVITVDRQNIVGHYIGGTEENMKRILEEARGNVLFIDEAYTLAKPDEKSGDFGIHAIECLLTILTEKNPDMVVIFAGYEKEMDALMKSNQGLSGRFPYHFHFPDYNSEELAEIAQSIIATDEYLLTEDALKHLKTNIGKACASRDKEFGNARWVEQYIHNWIIPALADRLSEGVHTFSSDIYKTIEAADIDRAYSQLAKTRTKKDTPQRRSIGFDVA